jgi:hypothetical protein
LVGEGVILVGDQQDGGKKLSDFHTVTKKYRVSPVGFMSIAFFLEQTDVLKQTHIVITDNQVYII